MIEFSEVSKSYPGSEEPVVRELSFTVPEGEICILVGPGGCGKTTTMRMVNRLIEPTSGEILIDGEPNTKMSATALRRKIGYAIQEIGLFPHRTIRENVSTVPELLEWSRDEIDDRALELLRLDGLETVADLAKASEELTLASFGECQENPACFPNIENNYDINFEDITVVDSLGLRYQALKQGDAQAAIGFTTDAQLLSDDLVVLEEEKDIWPYYYATPVIDQSYLEEHPRVPEIVNPVSRSLGVEDIRELNGRVDLDNEDPADVAEEYLQENGFLE